MNQNNKHPLIRSFKNAYTGLLVGLKERNFKIQLAFAVTVIVAAFFLNVPTVEILIILVLIATVLAAELLNSALEYALDIITKEHHPDIGKAKDTAAAAVLTLSLTAVLVGGYIFIKAFLSFI